MFTPARFMALIGRSHERACVRACRYGWGRRGGSEPPLEGPLLSSLLLPPNPNDPTHTQTRTYWFAAGGIPPGPGGIRGLRRSLWRWRRAGGCFIAAAEAEILCHKPPLSWIVNF